jgi:Fe(3+) dicitrate transport protein
MAKARVNTDPSAEIYNEASIKLGYAREDSRETYLGLTDADFRQNPLRRYPASALDRMQWDRFQIELSHAFAYKDVARLVTTAYRHDFHRAWFKLNRFDGEQPLEQILADPTAGRAVLLDILKGADSGPLDPALLIGDNDRTFVAQGIQTSLSLKLPKLWRIEQHLQLGARFHYDSIDRLHTEDSFDMVAGEPVSDGRPTETVVDNFGEAFAFAAYAIDEISLWRFLLTPGMRVEYVVTGYEDAAGITADTQQRAILPGVGLLFQVMDELSFLGGVHLGFSPAAPQDPGVGPTGEPIRIEPEVAVNYEAGSRLDTRYLDAELIGFYSDYSNLTGECTFSQGCDPSQLDRQFNAGDAVIYGLEASVGADIDTPTDLSIPLRLTYTLTETEFRSSFTSDNPAFAEVVVGDEMPYVPKHQLAAIAGLDSTRWGGLHLGATYVDAMRETAGQGDVPEGGATDAFVVFDATALLHLTPELSIYGKVENLLDNEYIVSRRPFGARPGRPRFIYGGVKVLIDRP